MTEPGKKVCSRCGLFFQGQDLVKYDGRLVCPPCNRELLRAYRESKAADHETRSTESPNPQLEEKSDKTYSTIDWERTSFCVIAFVLGGLMIYYGEGLNLNGIPLRYVGYVLSGVGGLGLIGVNVFKGDPWTTILLKRV